MSYANIEFNRPRDWQAFERLTRELFQILFDDPHIDLNGSCGQRQCGVDIIVRTAVGVVGVQCKGRNDTVFSPLSGLSAREFLAEIEEAKKFSPELRKFIVVTTAKNDADLKRLAEEKTEEHKQNGLFEVIYHAWDWFENRFSTNDRMMDLAVRHHAIYRDPRVTLSETPDQFFLDIGSRLRLGLSLINVGRQPEEQISEPALAEHLGLDWKQLANLFRGRFQGERPWLTALCEKLHLSPTWLIDGQGEPFTAFGSYNTGVREIFEFIYKLSPERIVFMRTSGEWSSTYILLKVNKIHSVRIERHFPVRSRVGGSGRAAIIEFYCLLRALKIATHLWARVRGGHVPLDELTLDVIHGVRSPHLAIDRINNDDWWDEISDLMIHPYSENHPWAEEIRSVISMINVEKEECSRPEMARSERAQLLAWINGSYMDLIRR